MAWWKFWDKKALNLEPPKALPPAPSGLRVTSMAAPWGEYIVEHPGQGLTARRIVEIFREAEVGYPARQCDLFDDIIERDAHLRSQIDGRVEAVVGKPWIVQAGGDTPEDDLAARLLEDALRAIPNITDTLEHVISASFYGYAGTEIVWEQRNGITVPVWLANVPHRRFRFDELDCPRLLTRDNLTTGLELDPGKWIFERRRNRTATRAGLMRTATWWSFFKTLSVRDWQIFSARFGLPYVTGEHGPDASEEDIKTLKKAVLSLGKDGAAVFSEACKLVIHETKTSANNEGVHAAITELCNREISKLISGATLTSESGGPGSFALGRVHADRSFDITQGDAERLGIRIEQEVGRPFVHFNGMTARPPRLKVHVIREVDPEKRMRIASIFANELGGALDEDQIRQEFQFKKPVGGQLVGSKKPDSTTTTDPSTPPPNE